MSLDRKEWPSLLKGGLSVEEAYRRLPKDQKYEIVGYEHGRFLIKREDGLIYQQHSDKLHQKARKSRILKHSK